MAKPSFLWIGNEETQRLNGLEAPAAMKPAGSTTLDQLQQLTSPLFDFALIEDHEQTEQLLRSLHQRPGVPLFVVSHTLDPKRRRRLTAAGAEDVLPPPSQTGENAFCRDVETGLQRARQRRTPLPAPHAPRPAAGPSAPNRMQGIIAESASIQGALSLATRAAQSRATVLLSGETGSGKEVLARAVHELGPRRGRPFIAVNCAAFPESLLESELFGHVRGAFTGASRDKTGLLELAGDGTFFLDEIGETSGPLQAKLLRVLQERELRPVGGNQTRSFHARIVVASNRDLLAEAKRGHFRTDLYYRLAVFPIHVPPLRERSEDVLPLARHFLRLHRAPEDGHDWCLSPAAERLLLAYDWPGNVRELENEMQRAIAMAAPGDRLGPRHLSGRLVGCDDEHRRLSEDSSASLSTRVSHFERLLIGDALERHGGNRTATARALGLSREGLHKKMKRLAFPPRSSPATPGRDVGASAASSAPREPPSHQDTADQQEEP